MLYFVGDKVPVLAGIVTYYHVFIHIRTCTVCVCVVLSTKAHTAIRPHVVFLPGRGWALLASRCELLASRKVNGQSHVKRVADAWHTPRLLYWLPWWIASRMYARTWPLKALKWLAAAYADIVPVSCSISLTLQRTVIGNLTEQKCEEKILQWTCF